MNTTRILRRSILFLTIVYWSLIVTLTHMPHPPRVGPPMSDKLQHFIGYGILTSLVYLSMWSIRPDFRRTWFWAPTIVLFYGALDEWTQPLTGRTCDIHDWLADFAGAAVAVIVLLALWRWLIASRLQTR